jgi:hypothetical protein
LLFRIVLSPVSQEKLVPRHAAARSVTNLSA